MLQIDTSSMASYGKHFATQFHNTDPSLFLSPAKFLALPFTILYVNALATFPKGKAFGHSTIPGEALIAAADIIAHPVTLL
jgi:hypothetical protein